MRSNRPPFIPSLVEVHDLFENLPGERVVEQEKPLQKPNSSSVLLGFSCDQDPHVNQFYRYDDQDEYSLIKMSIRRMNRDRDFPIQFAEIPDERNSSKLAKEIAEQRVKIRKMVQGFEQRLLAVYFQIIYPAYPVVDKQSFLQEYAENPDNADVGVLAGLMALSIIWWKYDPVLCVHDMPNGLYEKLFDECVVSIERQLKYPTLATIQAILLLLQKRVLPSETAESYATALYVAQVVALSHTLGLHIDCSSWKIPGSEKRLRHRLWTLIYIGEKWNSVNLGRPSILSSNQYSTSLGSHSQPEDGVSSDQYDHSLLNRLASLTDILDRIQSKFYSVANYRQIYSDPGTADIVDGFFDEMHVWRHTLPEELQSMTAKPGDICVHGPLLLSALTIEVLLHRIKLHPYCSNLLPESQLLQYRADAAITIQNIVKFTSEITHAHLHAFWYPMSRLNFSTIAFFMLYYHITSPTSQEFAQTKELLQKWLWALRVLAQGWQEGAGLAILRMNTIFWSGPDVFISDIPGNQDSMDSDGQPENGFLDFTNVEGYLSYWDDLFGDQPFLSESITDMFEGSFI